MTPAFGNLTTEKPEGYKQAVVVQLNGTVSKLCQKVKIDKCIQLINCYEVNIITYANHGLNMARLKPYETFNSFFDAEIEL